MDDYAGSPPLEDDMPVMWCDVMALARRKNGGLEALNAAPKAFVNELKLRWPFQR